MTKRNMKTSTAHKVLGLLFGAGFGFVLAAANLHEYDTIHKMLRLEEIDVFLLMGGAIGTSLPLLWWLERRRANTALGGPLFLSRSKPRREHVFGGALFGIGWAVSGTCPAPALVMLVSGAGLAAVTIAGLFVGLNLRDAQVRRNAGAATAADGEHRDVVTVR
ncbi:MAG: DUF6691 family protein [Ilumatobacteraceae bacterium]|jgi:uncharacterized membrane protein YedE/YeeE